MAIAGVLYGMLVLTVAGCSSAGAGEPAAADSSAALVANAIVESVIDGDTLDLRVGGRRERVRLIGIDTPEIAHPSFGDRPANVAECFGDDAKRYTTSLLPAGTSVRLERDVVARDDYGRLLAYLYRAADGVFVNYEIIRQGYAQPLSIAPNTRHAPLLVEATRAAESDDAGLWSACRNR
jgi:micrococcal nuclease